MTYYPNVCVLKFTFSLMMMLNTLHVGRVNCLQPEKFHTKYFGMGSCQMALRRLISIRLIY